MNDVEKIKKDVGFKEEIEKPKEEKIMKTANVKVNSKADINSQLRWENK